MNLVNAISIHDWFSRANFYLGPDKSFSLLKNTQKYISERGGLFVSPTSRDEKVLLYSWARREH
jgi:hypothetical protein